VGYGSCNYYVLGRGAHRLLIDIGWPGTLPRLQNMLKRKGVAQAELAALLVTHYHPDHAGLTQELRNLGVRLLVLDSQQPGIPLLAAIMKPSDGYVPIVIDDLQPFTTAASRSVLEQFGVAGQIIATPGHSADCVTLVTADGAAFTGDLPPSLGEGQPEYITVERSWQAIRSLGATTVYPGHGPAGPIRPG
jgi:endoribonuclease LACTB2